MSWSGCSCSGNGWDRGGHTHTHTPAVLLCLFLLFPISYFSEPHSIPVRPMRLSRELSRREQAAFQTVVRGYGRAGRCRKRFRFLNCMRPLRKCVHESSLQHAPYNRLSYGVDSVLVAPGEPGLPACVSLPRQRTQTQIDRASGFRQDGGCGHSTGCLPVHSLNHTTRGGLAVLTNSSPAR